jgi:hypothetical protein
MKGNNAFILHGCTTCYCQQCFMLNLFRQEPMNGLRSSCKLPCFKLIWIFLTYSHEVPNIRLHKSLSSGNRIDTRRQMKRTDMTTLIGALCEAPKNGFHFNFKKWLKSYRERSVKYEYGVLVFLFQLQTGGSSLWFSGAIDAHTLPTFKFVVKFVSLFCCLYWTPLLSLWCLNNGPTSQDSLPVPYLHQFSLLPGKKIVCNLLCLFLLKLLVIQTQELLTTACFLHVPHAKIWRFWWQFCSRKFHAFHQPWLCKLKPDCTAICYPTC